MERGNDVLQKVKISGGGRCNVTHACFVNRELAKNYPRGERELMSPFSRFSTNDTIDWFEQRGVSLKIEEDGRMFPMSNRSQTIIDCFASETERLGINVCKNSRVERIKPQEDERIEVIFNENSVQKTVIADRVMVAAGSSAAVWEWLRGLGHTIIEPVPSLFTFNIKDGRLDDLAGVSVPRAQLSVLDVKLKSEGPLLVTHWGLSGPSVLRLSAWGARALHEKKHNFELTVNWTADYRPHEILEYFIEQKLELARKMVSATPQYGIPSRLWQRLIWWVGIDVSLRWSDVTKVKLEALANELGAGKYAVEGKSTFKEEFVTAGGISLNEINFKRMESKVIKNLFFAGEILNIDAITGGFNFQAAWSGAWIAGNAMAE